MADKVKQNWVILVLLAITCLILFASNIKTTAFFEEDEPWYAETARNIAHTGDWMTLKYNNEPFFEKPPLLMWSSVATSSVFGWDELGVRLPSVIYGMLTVLALFWFGMDLFGRRRAIYSAVILMTSLQFILQSQLAYLDVLLSFCITMSILLFARNIYRLEDRRDRESVPLGASDGSIWWAYVFLGLGALAKGPIAIVLSLGALLIYLAVNRRLRLISKLRPVTGMVLTLVIALPWYIYETVLYGDKFVNTLVGYHMLNRFLAPIEAHGAPWFYFAGIVGLGFFPWSAFLPAVIYSWKQLKGESLWVLWAVAVLGFFSISKTKLPGYFLPSFPALAILVAAWWDKTGETISGAAQTKGRSQWPMLFSLITLTIISVILSVFITYLALFHFSKEGFSSLGPLLPAVIWMLGFSLTALVFLINKADYKKIFALVALGGGVFFLILISTLGRAVADHQPMRPIGEAIHAKYYSAGTIVASYPFYSRDLQYYSQIGVKGLYNSGELIAALKAPERILVMVKLEDFTPQLIKSLPPYYLLFEKANGVLISNKKRDLEIK